MLETTDYRVHARTKNNQYQVLLESLHLRNRIAGFVTLPELREAVTA